jgi:hypothetical protein
MMKSINRLLFVRRQQGKNLLLLRTQRPIYQVPMCAANLEANHQQFNQTHTDNLENSPPISRWGVFILEK